MKSLRVRHRSKVEHLRQRNVSTYDSQTRIDSSSEIQKAWFSSHDNSFSRAHLWIKPPETKFPVLSTRLSHPLIPPLNYFPISHVPNHLIPNHNAMSSIPSHPSQSPACRFSTISIPRSHPPCPKVLNKQKQAFLSQFRSATQEQGPRGKQKAKKRKNLS